MSIEFISTEWLDLFFIIVSYAIIMAIFFLGTATFALIFLMFEERVYVKTCCSKQEAPLDIEELMERESALSPGDTDPEVIRKLTQAKINRKGRM